MKIKIQLVYFFTSCRVPVIILQASVVWEAWRRLSRILGEHSRSAQRARTSERQPRPAVMRTMRSKCPLHPMGRVLRTEPGWRWVRWIWGVCKLLPISSSMAVICLSRGYFLRQAICTYYSLIWRAFRNLPAIKSNTVFFTLILYLLFWILFINALRKFKVC